MRISEHISYAEAIKSQTAVRHGIDNIPNASELSRMQLLANEVFEPVRVHFGVPIYISSFFRNQKLNTLIGGSQTSQHRTGEAIDIDADVYGGVTNMKIFNFIRENLDWDQLIFEFGTKSNPAWVHVSYRSKARGGNRREALQAYSEAGRTVYRRL